MKAPSPSHPISISPAARPVRVVFGDKTIADSEGALLLQEADYPVVYYIPRVDADMTAFNRTNHKTHCPYKGEASYFTLIADGKNADNACWSYERPYPAVSQIKDYLAFYPQFVRILTE